jgi:Domain of unknown function (DUF4386)
MKDISDESTLKTIRVTGILFLLALLIPTLNWIIVFSPFQSYESIIEKKFIFRINIINQIISAICIIVLGFFLHQILKKINHRISSLAYGFRMLEAALTLVIALFFLVVFSMLKHGLIELPVFRELVKNYISFTAVPGMIMGISMLLFSILFYKSGIIPKWLAILGIASFVLVIIYDSSVILNPNTRPLIQVIGSAPVGLFQVIIAFYLMFYKNIRIKKLF